MISHFIRLFVHTLMTLAVFLSMSAMPSSAGERVAGLEVERGLLNSIDMMRIVVDGGAMAQAVYPVTVDPEIGANDFRLSDMGPDGDANFDADFPAVAYNTTNNEYLVVWEGDDNTPPLVDDEREIFGQRVNAATGAEVGANDFRISDMPATQIGFVPAVAYNSTNNEYLVVWRGEDTTSGEWEVFGQRLNAATGAEVGANDFRMSDMGPDGNTNFAANFIEEFH